MLPPERPQPGSGRLPWLPGHNKAGVQKGFVLSHLCTKGKSPPSLLVLCVHQQREHSRNVPNSIHFQEGKGWRRGCIQVTAA